MYFLPWAGMKFCETRLAYHYLPSLNGVCQPRFKSWQADTGRRKDGDTATTLGLFMLPPNLEAGWQLVFLLPRFAAGKMDCQDCHCKACTPALTWAPFRLGKQWYENVIDRTFTKSKQTMTKVEGGSTPRVVAGKIATWWDCHWQLIEENSFHFSPWQEWRTTNTKRNTIWKVLRDSLLKSYNV